MRVTVLAPIYYNAKICVKKKKIHTLALAMMISFEQCFKFLFDQLVVCNQKKKGFIVRENVVSCL